MSTIAFSDSVSRVNAVILPEVVATALVSGTVRRSAALSCFTNVPCGTRDSVVPVLSGDFDAEWIASTGDPDTGLKSVGAPAWDQQHLIAEELAVIVPVPLAVIADETFSISDAMLPLFTRAMARAIDRAAIFGVNKPPGWTANSLFEEVTAVASNIVAGGTDPVEDILLAAEIPSAQGYIIDTAVIRPGLQFKMAALRARDLIANPSGADSPFPLMIAGLPLYTNPPAFNSAIADSFVFDSSCLLIGMRQDMTITAHPDGVITDTTGKVISNMMQQDSVAYRCVMRIGYNLVKPPTDADLPIGSRSPVAMVSPGTALPPDEARSAHTSKGGKVSSH